MIIEYMNEYLQGEPGPNVYYMGYPAEWWRVLSDLRVLGLRNTEITLNDLPYVKTRDGIVVIYRSSDEGTILLQKTGNTLLTHLPCALWRRFMHYILSISFSQSHCYAEFDRHELVDEATMILSSEWSPERIQRLRLGRRSDP